MKINRITQIRDKIANTMQDQIKFGERKTNRILKMKMKIE